ncbi:hypothetical protein [Pseudemcibacter aquimaris]|uniref:hypothetical protein n=1 Tax=Pseudemcibacter aquimaris TaxID=2857064 RepID=UPI002010EE2A|nr:hypothetical protein [Pseudemcibacter aquimaris]MCC3860950.1 hypothetical protein [Pseudemcibacter aquimaris]WDU59768.1 hypothetical protein KW060_05805 [Pseudemcibacter aquimaris]
MRFLSFSLICVLAASTSLAAEKRDRALVKPGETYELCIDLNFAQKLEYGFISRRAMNFNIHFGEGDNVKFPVAEHLTREKNEIFTAMDDQKHCLTWTNPNDRGQWVNVIYNIR